MDKRFSFERVLRLALTCSATLLFVACDGRNLKLPEQTGQTPTPTPAIAIELGSPAAKPAVVPPSDSLTQVTFVSTVRGSDTPPEVLFLDEVDTSGNVITAGIAELRDDGTLGDRHLGDRTYTGVLMLGQTTSAERLFRSRAEVSGQSLNSNSMNFWISDCPANSRPPQSQAVAYDDITQSNIFINELTMRIGSGVAPDMTSLNGVASTINGRVLGCIPNLREFLVEFDGDDTAGGVYDAIDDLVADDSVTSASPNVQVEPEPTADQSLCTGDDCQWYLERVRAPQAWQIAGGGDEESGVAVIDFGVNCEHDELNCDEEKYNEDVIDHGTGVAGLIGARADNGTDVTGVAWNTQIYPLSFLGNGGASQYKMNELIHLSLAEDNVKVINISAVTSIDPNNQVRDSICTAIDSGRLVVTASGNAGTINSCQISQIFPAQYNASGTCENGANLQAGLIVVGATDRDNNLSEWDTQCSNTQYAEILAPGSDLYTTSSTGNYASKDGTSFAAPLVSGAAAVVWSAHPELTVEELHNTLITSGAELAASSSNTLAISSDSRVQGQPLLDIYAALGGDAAVSDTTPDDFVIQGKTGEALGEFSQSDPVTINGVETATTIDIVGGFYSIDGGPFTGAAGTIEEGQTVIVQVKTQPVPNTVFEATLTIGGVSEVYTAETGEIATAADNFEFLDLENAALGQVIESNILTLTGLTDGTAISISGGEYSVNGAEFVSEDGVLNAGETLQVRLTSSTEPATTTIATISVGDLSETFEVTTNVLDNEPNVFEYLAEVAAQPGTEYTSEAITISGINTSTFISVSGGAYSINGGAYTVDSGTVSEGDTISLRVMAPAGFGEEVFVSLNIGGIVGVLSVATENNVQPVVSNVQFSGAVDGEVVEGTVLTVTYDYSDADGDTEGDTQFFWYRSGTLINNLTASYTTTSADVGETILVDVIPVASQGNLTGATVSAEVAVIADANVAPVASNVSITDENGGSAIEGDILTASYDYSDTDGDVEGTTTFQWMRAGSPVPEETSQSYTTSSADVGFGISVQVTPVAATGETTGTAVTSSSVTVEEAPVVTIPVVTGVVAYHDVNLSGAVDENDILTVHMSEAIMLGAATPAQIFELQVAGDSFGTGASVNIGDNNTKVDIALGANPILTVFDRFQIDRVFEGDPSGLDIVTGIEPGLLSSLTEVDAAPSAPVDIFAGYVSASEPVDSVAGESSSAVADFDGDNDMDYVVAQSGGVSLCVNDGFGNFACNVVDTTNVTQLEVADINADGRPDLVYCCTGSAALVTRTNNGEGGFNAAVTIADQSNFINDFKLEDVTGDNFPDLLIAVRLSGLFVIPNNGTGQFSAAPTEIIAGINPWNIVLHDIDGDEDVDLVSDEAVEPSSTDNRRPVLYVNDGVGNFAAPQTIMTGFSEGFAFVDVLAGGNSELVTYSEGSVQIFQDIGDFQFELIHTVSMVSSPSNSFFVEIHAADVDGDTNLDLFVGGRLFLGVDPGEHINSGIAIPAVETDSTYITANEIHLTDFSGDDEIDVLRMGGSLGDGQFRYEDRLFINSFPVEIEPVTAPTPLVSTMTSDESISPNSPAPVAGLEVNLNSGFFLVSAEISDTSTPDGNAETNAERSFFVNSDGSPLSVEGIFSIENTTSGGVEEGLINTVNSSWLSSNTPTVQNYRSEIVGSFRMGSRGDLEFNVDPQLNDFVNPHIVRTGSSVSVTPVNVGDRTAFSEFIGGGIVPEKPSIVPLPSPGPSDEWVLLGMQIDIPPAGSWFDIMLPVQIFEPSEVQFRLVAGSPSMQAIYDFTPSRGETPIQVTNGRIASFNYLSADPEVGTIHMVRLTGTVESSAFTTLRVEAWSDSDRARVLRGAYIGAAGEGFEVEPQF